MKSRTKTLENQFFIKEEYTINSKAQTLEQDKFGEYWTAERIKKSSSYQYDVYKLAKKIILNKGYKSVMDLGSGPATKAKKFLYPHVNKLTLIDQPSCEKVATKTIPGAEFKGVNLEETEIDLSFKYDLIICADVIEHLYNPVPLLEIIKRHIKPQGSIIISTPERDILRGENCISSPHPAHVREWNNKELLGLFKKIGFENMQTFLLPPKKLSPIQMLKRSLIGRWSKRSNWYSCQMIACKYTKS